MGVLPYSAGIFAVTKRESWGGMDYLFEGGRVLDDSNLSVSTLEFLIFLYDLVLAFIVLVAQ